MDPGANSEYVSVVIGIACYLVPCGNRGRLHEVAFGTQTIFCFETSSNNVVTNFIPDTFPCFLQKTTKKTHRLLRNICSFVDHMGNATAEFADSFTGNQVPHCICSLLVYCLAEILVDLYGKWFFSNRNNNFSFLLGIQSSIRHDAMCTSSRYSINSQTLGSKNHKESESWHIW